MLGALNVGIFGASVEQIGALDQIPLYEHNNDLKKRWVSEGDKSSLAKKYICGGGGSSWSVSKDQYMKF